MKTLYFECSAGISGDMAIGAMLDLGVPFNQLNLGIEEIELKKHNVKKCGISAVKFDVFDKHAKLHADHSSHHIENIKDYILKSNASDNAKKTALKIFSQIADAEKKVHGIKNEKKIHLHEVGALDSIADIICLSICLEYLQPDEIIFSPINVGSGVITCAHGELPVPAPATAEILKNIPIYSDNTKLELTTPTGAAFVKSVATGFSVMPAGKIINIGYGAGSRELKNKANVLRCFLIESDKNSNPENEVYQIETQIDDMTAETLAPIFDKLLHAGALDVYITQILMKKQRPGFLLSVLSNKKNKHIIENIILTETTTFGLRCWSVERTCLNRKIEKFNSSLGQVRVKIGILNNIIKKMPEFDDCLKIAEKLNLPVKDVYNKILSETQNS